MCQIPGIPHFSCQGMCFIFSPSLLCELIRMMLLQTWGPCGKSRESDTPALRGKTLRLSPSAHSFPAFFLLRSYSTLFLFEPYITTQTLDLCAVPSRPVKQLLLTHAEAKLRQRFAPNYQTHSTVEEVTLSSGGVEGKERLRITKDLRVTH